MPSPPTAAPAARTTATDRDDVDDLSTPPDLTDPPHLKDPAPSSRVARTLPGFVDRAFVGFVVVGAASALAYLALFVLLRAPLGAQGANLVALVVTAVANTAVNRRVSFEVRGREGALRHHVQGLAVFAAGWGVSAGALAGAAAIGVGEGGAQLVVLVAATVLATLVRYVLLRFWVFRLVPDTASGRA